MLLKRQASSTAKIKTSNTSPLPSNSTPSDFPSAFSGRRATPAREKQVLMTLLPKHSSERQIYEPLGTLHPASEGTDRQTKSQPYLGARVRAPTFPPPPWRVFGWAICSIWKSVVLAATTEQDWKMTRKPHWSPMAFLTPCIWRVHRSKWKYLRLIRAWEPMKKGDGKDYETESWLDGVYSTTKRLLKILWIPWNSVSTFLTWVTWK